MRGFTFYFSDFSLAKARSIDRLCKRLSIQFFPLIISCFVSLPGFCQQYAIELETKLSANTSCQYSAGATCVKASYTTEHNKPSVLKIVFYQWDDQIQNGELVYLCYKEEIITLPDTECGSESFPVLQCNASASVSISWSPKISIAYTPQNDCIDKPFSITGTPDFSEYKWKYQVDGGAWNMLPEINGSEINNLTATQIFGERDKSIVNRSINFLYTIGNCALGQNSGVAGPYTFYADGPPLKQFSPVSPTCPAGDDGSATLDHSVEANTKYIYTNIAWIPGESCPPPGDGTIPEGLTPPPGHCFGWKTTATNTGTFPFTLGGLGGGKYTLKIEAEKDAGTSCFTSYDYEIADPPALSAMLSSSQPPSCGGGNDAISHFIISNHVDQYSWSVYDGPNAVKSGSSNLSTLVIKDLYSGDFILEVVDLVCGDVSRLDFNIPQGKPLTIGLTAEDPTCLTDANNDGNQEGNGTISVSVSPIEGKSYSYYLYTTGQTGHDHFAVTTSENSFHVFVGLPDLSFYVYAVTSNNCTATSNAMQLNRPAPLSMQLSSYDVTCLNSSDGKIELSNITKPGGTIRYNYTLSQPSNPGFTPVNSGTLTKSPANLIGDNFPAGDYKAVITDECAANSAQLEFNGIRIDSPPPIAIEGIEDLILSCADGSDNTSVTILSGPDDLSLDLEKNSTPMPGFPMRNLNAGTYSLGNLTLGLYTVTATEDCPVNNVPDATTSVDFEVVSNASKAITAEVSKYVYENKFNLTCPETDDGKIFLSVEGGVRGNDPSYFVELIDEIGSVILNNTSGWNSRANISNELQTQEGRINYEISGLSEFTSYQIRVSDYNSNPGNCVKLYSSDVLGRSLELSAPLSLSVKIPDLLKDFSGFELYNGMLYSMCKNDENGSYTAYVSGGNAPYSIRLYKRSPEGNWPSIPIQIRDSIADGAATFIGLGAGSYRVEAEDKLGCPSSARYFEVREASQVLTVNAINKYQFPHGANTTCYGDSDGQVTIEVSGGIGSYEYTLYADNSLLSSITKSNGDHTFGGLAAIKSGSEINYSFELRDELGCAWDGQNSSFTLISPEALSADWSVTSRIADDFEIPCRGNLATVRFFTAGGKYPHVLSLGEETRSIDEGSFTDLNLYAGSHTANFIDDLGCKSGPSAIHLREPSSHVDIILEDVLSPDCIGGNNGQIKVSSTGGTPFSVSDREYFFLIRKADHNFFDADTLWGTTATFVKPANHYSSQDYVVRVQDKFNCYREIQPYLPPNPQPLKLKVDRIGQPSCYGGTDGYIKVIADNYKFIGDTFLRFKISGGQYGDQIIEKESSSGSFDFDGLMATDKDHLSPYRAWVEDFHFCEDTAFQYLPSLPVQSYEPLQLSLIKVTRPGCFKGRDGSLLVKVSGGAPPYQFSRDNIIFYAVNSDSEFYAGDLEAGNHTFYVRDSNYTSDQRACVFSSVFAVPEGRSIRIEESVKAVACKNSDDGAIDVSVFIDNRPADEPQEYSRLAFSWTNDNISSMPFSSDEDISSLKRASYTVNISYDLDSITCRNSKTIVIHEPYAEFEVTPGRIYETSCGNYGDGKAAFTISGGWADSLSYYRLDDSEWKAFYSNTILVTDLAAGFHHVEIAQSGFKCISSSEFLVKTHEFEVIPGSTESPSCPFAGDGLISVKTDQPDVEFSINGNSYTSFPVFENLRAGTYNIRARSSLDNNCASSVLEILLSDPPDCGEGPLQLVEIYNSASTCPSARDGSARVFARGGVPPYRYYWDDDSNEGSYHKDLLPAGVHRVIVRDELDSAVELTIVIKDLEPIIIDSFETKASCSYSCDASVKLSLVGGSGNFTVDWNDTEVHDLMRYNLCPGNYSVRVSDVRKNACFLEKKITLVSLPDILVTTEELKAPVCHDGPDGSARVTVSGGSGSFALRWSSGESDRLFTGPPGEYSLIVTDAVLGCQHVSEITIPNTLPISVDPMVTPPLCYNSNTGKVSLKISNLPSPLVIWQDGQVGLSPTRLKPGKFGYQITGSNGCTASGEVTVPDVEKLETTEVTEAPVCHGDCSGSIKLIPQGGVKPYLISWAHGPVFPAIRSLCPGLYSYTVTDKNNCKVSGKIELDFPEPLRTSSVIVNPTCSGYNNGEIEVNASGGSGPYRFEWSHGGAESQLTNLPEKEYTVRITDSKNCQLTETFKLVSPPDLLIASSVIQNPSCKNSGDGSIYVQASGGVKPYAYSWTDGNFFSRRDLLTAGTYTLQYQDSKGCKKTKNFVLMDPAALEIVNVKTMDPSCYGESSGSIFLETTGAVQPLEYKWSSGQNSPSVANVPAGRYEIAITDHKKCTVKGSFLLDQPEKLEITGIPNAVALCTGSTQVITPEGNWFRYLWLGPNGLSQDQERITVKDKGKYALTVWNENRCSADTSFVVQLFDNLLKADFLRISESYVDEPIVFIDITHPIPRKTEWMVPDSVLINRQTADILEVVFPEPGDFEIGLRAAIDNCSSEVFKTINVSQRERDNADGRASTHQEENFTASVFPNPARDHIELDIHSDSREPVTVMLIKNLDGSTIRSETVDGFLDYRIMWDLNETVSGVFTVLFKHHHDKISTIRLVIIK